MTMKDYDICCTLESPTFNESFTGTNVFTANILPVSVLACCQQMVETSGDRNSDIHDQNTDIYSIT